VAYPGLNSGACATRWSSEARQAAADGRARRVETELPLSCESRRGQPRLHPSAW